MIPALKPRKLLDQLADVLRAKHYSYRTEQSYVHRVRQFILFHDKRHPREMGASEIERFVTWLATDRTVAAFQGLGRPLRLGRLWRELVKSLRAHDESP